jgi:hypothetical protein
MKNVGARADIHLDMFATLTMPQLNLAVFRKKYLC